MGKLLYLILGNIVGTGIARLLTGAGLSLVTFAALTPLVLSMLNAGANAFSGIASATLNIMLLSGLGVALSAIGSGILTRVAIVAAAVGIKKAAGA